jgi:flagellar export protein FliJ
MAFHFSLDAVLRMRRGQERAERLKLEAILSAQAQAQARLQEVTESSFELHRQFQQRLGGGMAGSELQFEAAREANATSVCSDLRTRLQELEQRRMAQVQIFYKVRQNREVLENLRLRKLNLYLIEQGRREQQELDDLFLMRRANRPGEQKLPGS